MNFNKLVKTFVYNALEMEKISIMCVPELMNSQDC